MSGKVLRHSTQWIGASEGMNFLGRKLNGNFQGEVVADLFNLACRRSGSSRIKHRVMAGSPRSRTRRWRVTHHGRNVTGTSLHLREHPFPNVYSGVVH